MTEYTLMFAAAFISATLLPAQSEAVLVAFLQTNKLSVWGLIAIATLGNTLGSASNWLLGMYFLKFRDRPWFPVSPTRLNKAERWYRRYGRWSLLLSWLPVVGDALTLAAGILREPFSSFFAITCTAKMLRYLAVAGLWWKLA